MLFIIAKVLFWILGLMFFVGIIGSAVVVLLTSIEDVKELRANEENEPRTVMQAHSFGDSLPFDAGRHA